MTTAQAEPPPERNHAPPSVDDMLSLDVMQEFLEFGDQAVSFATGSLAAGSYGMPLGIRPRSQRVRGTPYQRPNSGYVMRFPVEPIGHWDEGDSDIVQDTAARDQAGEFMGGLQVQIEAVDALTFNAMGAMPAEVVNALLNVPSVPLGQWHEMRARQRAQSAQRGQATPRSQRGARPAPRLMRARR